MVHFLQSSVRSILKTEIMRKQELVPTQLPGYRKRVDIATKSISDKARILRNHRHDWNAAPLTNWNSFG